MMLNVRNEKSIEYEYTKPEKDKFYSWVWDDGLRTK